ncbi:transcriptional regulator [Methylobacterium sp. WL18]|uniref:AbrB/MazE/SpoVT family DNA-binding domain-containing protein n=1 Tax=Methylobacterium sp. WL18 TaxID=2603897 RepID=UPI0011CB982A|nr:AbrB/MazE/SpoVT family DNA-binding domain-containing protein [Methylobacterium sp. WL18]TXN61623.1 transcriptional regulator [Methylobacterium sp. WL18]
MISLKVTQNGNSLSLTLPKEVSTRLKVEKGDVVHLTEAPDGSYRLTPYNPDFESQMVVAQAVMKRRREALRELAK